MVKTIFLLAKKITNKLLYNTMLEVNHHDIPITILNLANILKGIFVIM